MPTPAQPTPRPRPGPGWVPGGPDEAPDASTDGDPWEICDTEEPRPYAITGGRTRARHTMRLVTQLRTADPSRAEGMGPEAVQAVAVCQGQPCSVAEIAARIRHPVNVTRIILSDLVDCGALVVALPAAGAPDALQVLEGLRSGLKALRSDVA